MSAIRLAIRSIRPSMVLTRPISTTSRRLADNTHPNTPDYREDMKKKPLNPHMTNTNSTQVNEMPAAGKNKVPPEFISSVDGDFVPKDSVPENTERMTGGTQKGEPETGPNAKLEAGEMGVGELEGAKFRVEPLRRTGEDANTMRARLVYQSRKRGTLEADLLMSTFADTHLANMSMSQMAQYDLFLDENDWDIYYWATQEPTPTSAETAEGAQYGEQGATAQAAGQIQGKPVADAGNSGEVKLETDQNTGPVKPQSGEWAQTIGTFKPAYRPVPARWKNSEILAMLRRHVISRSAGGIHEGAEHDVKASGGGMAFMPEVKNMDI